MTALVSIHSIPIGFDSSLSQVTSAGKAVDCAVISMRGQCDNPTNSTNYYLNQRLVPGAPLLTSFPLHLQLLSDRVSFSVRVSLCVKAHEDVRAKRGCITTRPKPHPEWEKQQHPMCLSPLPTFPAPAVLLG
ncbi:hypothetical protein JOB18_022311 [Solea senegalensis]|uniref:ZP domain-containing protein n=1 Tax=Solea senegalensis TaxID=28829 RepID=A0AAV6QWB5_SOLSE|nr:hypothetical protein JOB18_022311 [Solea senegalensis]